MCEMLVSLDLLEHVWGVELSKKDNPKEVHLLPTPPALGGTNWQGLGSDRSLLLSCYCCKLP